MELQIQELEGEFGYVNLFYLIPDFRGKGLGKDLIRYAEDFFRKSIVTRDHLRMFLPMKGHSFLYEFRRLNKKEKIWSIEWENYYK